MGDLSIGHLSLDPSLPHSTAFDPDILELAKNVVKPLACARTAAQAAGAGVQGVSVPTGSPGFTAATPNVERAPLTAMTDSVPLFAEAGRRFTSMTGVRSVERVAGGARLVCTTSAAGVLAELLVQATTSGALRLRWSCPAGAAGTVRPADRMIEDGADPDPDAVLEVDGAAALLNLTTAAWRFLLNPDLGWRLLDPAGRILTQQRRDDRAFVHWISRAIATSSGEGLRTWSHESLALADGERLYGLGQVFGPLEKRGTRVVQWNRDAMGSNSSALTYHNTPFLLSSAGYGLVVHAGGRVLWEIGSPSYDTLTVGADGEVLDLFLLPGSTPADVLGTFAKLCGAPGDLPDFALGVWMSRCQYTGRDEVIDVVSRLEAMDFPFDVVHLDPRWMRQRRERADMDHGSDFTWDEGRFGDPREFFTELGAHGLRVSLWENPYALAHTRTAVELGAMDGIARDAEGAPAIPFEAPLGNECFVVDFTRDDVQRWWREQHRHLLELGASAFKTDFAEGVRDDTRFADGRTGAELHNVYALLFNRTVIDAQREHGVATPFVFGRSGWLGSHRYPLQWSGDAQCNWSDLRGALRAGLSAALSGTAWWASDIGGFYRLDEPLPDPELYARWAWLGCLSPVARFHGTSPREPYHYGREACAATLVAAQLRYRLLPYLASCRRGLAEGLPMVRPLVLEFPDDPRGWDEGTSYLLGDALLHAPLLHAGGARSVHLPPGRWADWWTGEVHQGPCDLEVEVALDRTPLYQREGTIIELGEGRRADEVLAGPRRAKRWDEPYVPT
jgi:alpha-D-xyloside xylohydrolase